MLKKCPECGKEVSDKAFTCPHCGAPLKTEEIKAQMERRKKNWRFAIIFSVVIVGLALIFNVFATKKAEKINSAFLHDRFVTAGLSDDQEASVRYILQECGIERIDVHDFERADYLDEDYMDQKCYVITVADDLLILSIGGNGNVFSLSYGDQYLFHNNKLIAQFIY